MIPEVNEILEYWTELSEYDPEQKSFMLGSLNYEWHNIGNSMKRLIENYDENGYLACLYLKHKAKIILSDVRVRLWGILEDRTSYESFYKLYSLLNSDNMDTIESKFREVCDKIIAQAYGPTKYIGQIPTSDLLNYLEDVIEYLPKCKSEIFVNSPIDQINLKSICSTIKVFNTAADCIFALNSAEDNMMYLCYITSRGSLDGYFSYMIKSGGNIISINDRVSEAFIGQHNNSRNGRWMDDKGYSIFPYSSFVEWSGSDYKGYATSATTKVDELKLSDLHHEDLIKVLLSCILIMNKTHKFGKAKMKEVYTISLLENNLSEESHALMIRNENQLVASQYNRIQSALSNITTEDVVNPEGNFDFVGRDNTFIDLYGQGFELDTTKIMKYNPLSLEGSNHDAEAEFLGSEEKIHSVYFSEARRQLAEYIRSQMMKEYTDFGGLDAITRWWKDAINQNVRYIILLCCAKYFECEGKGEKDSYSYSYKVSRNTIDNIHFIPDDGTKSGYCINRRHTSGTSFTYSCLSRDTNDYIANTWFTFCPQADENLREIAGRDLPKVMKGYRAHRHGVHVNPLLHVSDEVENIGCLFEDITVRRYNYELKDRLCRETNTDPFWAETRTDYNKLKLHDYGFVFSIGFSKREFKKMLNGNSCINTKYNITKDDIQNFINSYVPLGER